VTSPIKKLKLAVKMTNKDGSWSLTRLSKVAKAYKYLTKSTKKYTIIVTKGKYNDRRTT
jgi:hypothetical protein